MSTIEERVKKIVAEQLSLKESEVKNESSFVDDFEVILTLPDSTYYDGEIQAVWKSYGYAS